MKDLLCIEQSRGNYQIKSHICSHLEGDSSIRVRCIDEEEPIGRFLRPGNSGNVVWNRLGELRKTSTQVTLDETDLEILDQLQHNCKQSIAELAERVLLSVSACHRRIKAMEVAGVIAGYTAKLSAQKLGFRVEFFVELSLATQGEEAFKRFEKAVLLIPEVLECNLVEVNTIICSDRKAIPKTMSHSPRESTASWCYQNSVSIIAAVG